jgi:hypothetical protein
MKQVKAFCQTPIVMELVILQQSKLTTPWFEHVKNYSLPHRQQHDMSHFKLFPSSLVFVHMYQVTK